MWRRTAKFSRLECLFSKEQALLAHLEQSRVGRVTERVIQRPRAGKGNVTTVRGKIRYNTSPESLSRSQNSFIFSWRRNHPSFGLVPKSILAYHSAKPVRQHREFPPPRMGCRNQNLSLLSSASLGPAFHRMLESRSLCSRADKSPQTTK